MVTVLFVLRDLVARQGNIPRGITCDVVTSPDGRFHGGFPQPLAFSLIWDGSRVVNLGRSDIHEYLDEGAHWWLSVAEEPVVPAGESEAKETRVESSRNAEAGGPGVGETEVGATTARVSVETGDGRCQTPRLACHTT